MELVNIYSQKRFILFNSNYEIVFDKCIHYDDNKILFDVARTKTLALLNIKNEDMIISEFSKLILKLNKCNITRRENFFCYENKEDTKYFKRCKFCHKNSVLFYEYIDRYVCFNDDECLCNYKG